MMADHYVPAYSGPRESPPKKKKGYVKIGKPVKAASHLAYGRWTPQEKKLLLDAIKKVQNEDQLVSVYGVVPTKSRHEVAREVLRLKMTAAEHGPVLKAPIETWLDFAVEMLHYEIEDHSKNMGKAMSLVANYTDMSTCAPNYKRVYEYLAAVLDNTEPPSLSPLESAIILDLMHSLADVLSSVDTSLARQVMHWKFCMLNCKVDINNVGDSAVRANRALNNEFLDDCNITLGDVPNTTNPSPDNELNNEEDMPTTSAATKSNVLDNSLQQPSSLENSEDMSAATKIPVLDDALDKNKDILTTSDVQSFMSQDAFNSQSASMSVDASSISDVASTELQGVAATSASARMSLDERMDDDAPPAPSENIRKRPLIPNRKRGRVLKKPMFYSLNPFCIPMRKLNFEKKGNQSVQKLKGNQNINK